MTTFLPKVIEDIIYTYINELKTEDIKNELISKIQRCERCDENVVVHKKMNKHSCECGAFLCTHCYEGDLMYLRDDATYHQCKFIVRCLCCLEYDDWDEITDDDESIDEDAIWQEMYGISSWSEIY
jgi:hypothetical protein